MCLCQDQGDPFNAEMKYIPKHVYEGITYRFPDDTVTMT